MTISITSLLPFRHFLCQEHKEKLLFSGEMHVGKEFLTQDSLLLNRINLLMGTQEVSASRFKLKQYIFQSL